MEKANLIDPGAKPVFNRMMVGQARRLAHRLVNVVRNGFSPHQPVPPAHGILLRKRAAASGMPHVRDTAHPLPANGRVDGAAPCADFIGGIAEASVCIERFPRSLWTFSAPKRVFSGTLWAACAYSCKKSCRRAPSGCIPDTGVPGGCMVRLFAPGKFAPFCIVPLSGRAIK